MIDRVLPAHSYISRIRGVPLLPEEKVARVLSLDDGLLPEPPAEGRLLIATNRRILYFTHQQGYDETSLLPVEELRGVTLSAAKRGSLSWLRALALGLGAVAFYLVVSYWLVARVPSPTLPVVNMDAVPLALLALLLAGAWFMSSRYIRQPGGAITFHGGNWTLPVSYRKPERMADIQAWLNALFICRAAQQERLRPQD